MGPRHPTRIMGIINTSSESFYKKSIMQSPMQLRDAVIRMEQDGAHVIDVGAMSTAPYLNAAVSEGTEMRRMMRALRIICDATNLPISVDTCRANVARAALESGADMINDISGLKYDPAMSRVVADFEPPLILCAFDAGYCTGNPVTTVQVLLQESIAISRASGADCDIVLDPAVGFFRRDGRGKFFTRSAMDWRCRDQHVIRNIGSIGMGFPTLVSVSNKSIVGWLFGMPDPATRMYGSVVLEAICVLNGADIIRTHNVAQTRQAIQMARNACTA